MANQPEVDRPRQEVEEEEEIEKAAARKVQAKEKAKQAAIVAEAERQKRKEARLSPPVVSYVSNPYYRRARLSKGYRSVLPLTVRRKLQELWLPTAGQGHLLKLVVRCFGAPLPCTS